MAIKIKIISANKGGSNKSHITPKSDPGHADSQPSQPTYVHELKPFIDWLTINITPAEEDQHDIYNAFWTAVDDNELFADADNAEKKAVGIGFNVAKRIVLQSISAPKKRPTLFVKLLNKEKLVTKLRLNLVPVDLGPEGLVELHSAINMIVPDGWEYVVKHGRVTRIDVAVDLPDLTMDSIHFLPKKVAHIRMLFPDGELETIYIGKPRSDQIVIYDRRKKRAKQHQEVPQGLRIERRVKPGSMKLSNLPLMNNPLAGAKLLIALPGPPNAAKEWEWSLFSDSVEKRGLSAALALLPKDRKAVYRKHIEDHKLSAWDPVEIWKCWKPMLDVLKIASPNW